MLGLNPKTSSFGINNQITSHSHSIHIHCNSIHNQSQLFTRQSKYMPRVRPNKSQMHRHKNMKNKHGTSLLFPTHSCNAKCSSPWWLRRKVHNEMTKLQKQFTLEGLHKKVTDHLSGWTIFNGKVSSTDPVGNEIIATVEMFSLLGAGPHAVLLK